MYINHKIIRWTFGIMLAGVILLAFFILNENDDALTVRFLDVGQGDAILVSEGSLNVLIDGGKDPKRIREFLGEYLPFWDDTVDVLVATHPDEDHIGGLTGVFDRYRVATVLQTRESSDSEVFARFSEGVARSSSVEAFAPLSVVFPNGAQLETVFPDEAIDPEKNKDTNDASIVMRLTYGDHSFLFTGDFPNTEEGNVSFDSVDVLKVSHHGSKNATTQAFLQETTPQEGIISVGKNRYGHPTQETLDRLRLAGADILRTDERGTISFVCHNDGNHCDVNTEK